jgi:hypothetical protein
MKKIFFFLDKFGDLDHVRNLIFYLSSKNQVFIFQNQLNQSIDINDYVDQKLYNKLVFFPRIIFFFYKLVNKIRFNIRNKLINRIIFNILKLLNFFFSIKKKNNFLRLVDKKSSVIFVGHIDEKILNLKKKINFKSTYLLHAVKTHNGFYNRNFENLLKKKKYVKNLDLYIANNFNHWNSGGIQNEPLFLANPRYLKKFQFYKKRENKINLLLIIDKIKQSYLGNNFYYVNKEKYKEVLDFVLQFDENIIIKLHPSLDRREIRSFIDLEKYKKNIYVNEKKTEELIVQSEKIIGFGSSSLMDAFIYEKKILIPAHCLKYKSLFYECAPNNVSYNFNDFKTSSFL